MNNLTIVIPAHRNDYRLIRAIQSAQWAEVLIIDQEAQVDWSKLKQQFKFKLLSYPKLISFSDMKNTALEHVQTDWVFFLDSDEYISLELKKEIEHNLKDKDIDGMRLQREDVFLNEKLTHGETRNANFLRVIRRGKAEWVGEVHEELQLKSNTIVTQLLNPLYHEPHTSIHEFIQKINLYTSVLAKQKEQSVVLKSVFLPVGKFFYTFFVKFGFLDGYRGLVYSLIMSIHSSVVRIKRYEA